MLVETGSSSEPEVVTVDAIEEREFKVLATGCGCGCGCSTPAEVTQKEERKAKDPN